MFGSRDGGWGRYEERGRRAGEAVGLWVVVVCGSLGGGCDGEECGRAATIAVSSGGLTRCKCVHVTKVDRDELD